MLHNIDAARTRLSKLLGGLPSEELSKINVYLTAAKNTRMLVQIAEEEVKRGLSSFGYRPTFVSSWLHTVDDQQHGSEIGDVLNEITTANLVIAFTPVDQNCLVHIAFALGHGVPVVLVDADPCQQAHLAQSHTWQSGESLTTKFVRVSEVGDIAAASLDVLFYNEYHVTPSRDLSELLAEKEALRVKAVRRARARAAQRAGCETKKSAPALKVDPDYPVWSCITIAQPRLEKVPGGWLMTKADGTRRSLGRFEELVRKLTGMLPEDIVPVKINPCERF
jgi:hypothetical protein